MGVAVGDCVGRGDAVNVGECVFRAVAVGVGEVASLAVAWFESAAVDTESVAEGDAVAADGAPDVADGAPGSTPVQPAVASRRATATATMGRIDHLFHVNLLVRSYRLLNLVTQFEPPQQSDLGTDTDVPLSDTRNTHRRYLPA